jgi:hypothetical protein
MLGAIKMCDDSTMQQFMMMIIAMEIRKLDEFEKTATKRCDEQKMLQLSWAKNPPTTQTQLRFQKHSPNTDRRDSLISFFFVLLSTST